MTLQNVSMYKIVILAEREENKIMILMANKYKRLLIPIIVFSLTFFASCSGNDQNERGRIDTEAREEIDTEIADDDNFALEDMNFYTMNFPELYKKTEGIIDPENGQMSIKPVNGHLPIEILFNTNGDIENLALRLFVRINSTETDFTMGSYIVRNIEEQPGSFEVHRIDSDILYAKDFFTGDFEESFNKYYDFPRFKRFCDSFPGSELKALLEASLLNSGRETAYFQFSSDNLELRDYQNFNIRKTYYRLTSDGIENVDPADYKSNEDIWPDDYINRPVPDTGGYIETTFNDEATRYYLIVPYYVEQQDEADKTASWRMVDYYCNDYIIIFEQ